jgi:hypothetical protein
MATTKKKRKRKHAGTQAGTIQRAAREKAPQTKEERREATRQRRIARMERPPTLKGAASRAAIGAVVFAVLVLLVFRQPVVQALLLGGLMFLVYIPIGYMIDLFVYRRYLRRKAAGGGAGGGR